MQIFPLRKSYVDEIVELESEFEDYIQSLSSYQRDPFDRVGKKQQLLQYAFGKEKIFSGYVAKIGKEIVGFVFYHYGFDPDEMQGKVIYMFELFVSKKSRGKGAGRALIEKLQSHEDSLGIYFGVWKKNIPTIEFYKKLGADWVEDVPFMKLLK